MDKIRTILKKAEDFLRNNPYDEGHDLDHHLNVWKNAKEIAAKINLPIDLQVLQIACMWHDVVTTQITNRNFKGRDRIILQTTDFLVNYMTELKFTKDFIQKTTVAIKEHDLNSRPTTREGKILYDADKLEFLSIKRWIKILNALKTGRMAKIKLFLYKKAGKRWFGKLKRMYNFAYTRELHDKKVNEILKNKVANKIANDLGEDLHKILIYSPQIPLKD